MLKRTKLEQRDWRVILREISRSSSSWDAAVLPWLVVSSSGRSHRRAHVQLDASSSRVVTARVRPGPLSPESSNSLRESSILYVMSTSSIPLQLCEAYPMLIYMLFTTTRTW